MLVECLGTFAVGPRPLLKRRMCVPVRVPWRTAMSARSLLIVAACMACWLFFSGIGSAQAATGSVSLVQPAGSVTGSISAGGYHTCALKTDGTLACWGDNSNGQATPPSGTFTQVSAGFAHNCVLRTDSTLACWGDNSFGQLNGIPSGTFSQVSAGQNHTCAIKTDGTLACWGDNSFGQATAPTGTFSQVSAGFAHTCAIKTDGTLTCWGNNNDGQINAPAGTFTQVSAGTFHSCALKTDGTLACWGDNSFGQAAPPTGTFSQVGAGTRHTCGIKTDGTLACWGDNVYDQLNGIPAGTFTQVSAGAFHTCALRTDGTLACWGDNQFGQASAPAGVFAHRAVISGAYHSCEIRTTGTLACWGYNANGQATPPSGSFSQISAGEFDTCGIKTGGTLACWGDNTYSQSTPPAGAFSQVSAGQNHTCALKTDGTLACWGDNSFGATNAPTGTFSQVSAGYLHTCAIKTDGTLTCWGYNAKGQSTPPAGTFTQVSATGGYHSCAIKTDGTLACWGFNLYGQSTPPAGTFSQVSAGQYHTCGIKTDGTLACWGYNSNGQSTPPAGTFSQVSAGYRHTCALKTDGTIACWGNNSFGQTNAPNPPLINTQPSGAALTVGDTLTLSVAATGNPAPTYQWYHGTTAIPLATSSTYTVNSVVVADAGSYYVVVSNSEGDVPSTTVGVTVAKATPVLAWPAPAAITYGTLLSAAQLDATASFKGNPVPGTFTYTPAAGARLNAGANQPLAVSFVPTDTANFTSPVTGGTTITVNKASQTIAFPTILPHTYGDAPFTVSATGGASGNPVTFTLSGNCTATSVSPGTISITLTGAGSCTVNADQIGDSNYSAAPQVSHSFNIAKATPVLAWPAPAPITYGTLLSATQLDATASFKNANVPGVFTYTPAAGTRLNAGANQPLAVSFTPTDTANFNSPIAGGTTITVTKAATSTSLSSSLNPATIGQSVTFTAIVTSGGGTPTGTVTFYDNAVPLGSGTLVAGSATLTTSSLAAGTHSITAVYAGDSNFLSSPSPALSQVVATCSLNAFLLEGLRGSFNAAIAGKPGLVNLNYARFSEPGGNFSLGNIIVTACANPGTANSMATISGTVNGTPTGLYQAGDQITITVWSNGPAVGPEAQVNDSTRGHSYMLTGGPGGIAIVKITTP